MSFGDQIRPIPGFPSYGATANGTIWRVIKKNPRILKGALDKDGYIHHHISECGKDTNITAHKMVALAFLGRRPEGMQIAHADGNCRNNAVSNLRWCTALENHADKKRHGTTSRGEKNCNALLTYADVEWIRAYPKRRGMFRAMANRLQLTITAVHAAYHGKTWTHVPHAGGVPNA